MGLVLNNYSTDGVPVPGAYLRIDEVDLLERQKQAIVRTSIHASKAAATAGQPPLQSANFLFDDNDPATPTLALYTSNFAQGAKSSPVNNAVPSTVDDMLWTLAYLALPSHPSAAVVVAGATAQ